MSTHYEVVTVADPDGYYTVVVTATHDVSAQYDLEVTAFGEVILPFNGGSGAVVDQGPQTWRYYRVDVPTDTLAGTFV